MRRAALVLLALALTGCETTAEKSAKLEKAAKLQAKHRAQSQRGLSITHQSSKVKVLEASVLGSAEGAAAIVSVRNTSATALRDLPIEITVRGNGGTTVYSNNSPGLATTLVSIALLPAHAELTWVDDQVPTDAGSGRVSAKIGEGEALSGAIPKLSVHGAAIEQATASEPELEGSVLNHSPSTQSEVIVYALARRRGHVVAAGRAVLPQVAAGASTHFQLYFIGDPRGAQLQLSAVAGAA